LRLIDNFVHVFIYFLLNECGIEDLQDNMVRNCTVGHG